MKKIAPYPILFFMVFVCQYRWAFAQEKQDKRLSKEIHEVIKDFRGDIGIYVKHLSSNRTVNIQADSIFPTASMIKVPIMIGTFDKILKKELKYDQILQYSDSLKYDDGIVGSLKNGTNIPLNEVMMLMCTVSDNTGSLWLQALAGGGKRINVLMDSLGLLHTRVNSRTPGRENNRTLYGWGQTTPREMATIFIKLRNGEVFTKDASDRMYRNLGRNYWDSEGLSQIPSSIKAISKNGAVNRSRSETAVIHAPHGDYVYSIITKNQQDESWERNNEGFEIIRKITTILWKNFEPNSKFSLIEGYENW